MERIEVEYDKTIFIFNDRKHFVNKKLKETVYSYIVDCILGTMYCFVYRADQINKHGLIWELVGITSCERSSTATNFGKRQECMYSFLTEKRSQLGAGKLRVKNGITFESKSYLALCYPNLSNEKDLLEKTVLEIFLLDRDGELRRRSKLKKEIEALKNISFGIEIEYTGTSRFRSAKAIATTIFGGKLVHKYKTTAPQYYVTDQAGRDWQFRYDSSIRAAKNGRAISNSNYKCELVSPLCTIEDLPLIAKIVQALKNSGMTVNSTCSVHIHVDANSLSSENLRWLALMIAAHEEMLYKALKVDLIRRSNYCSSMNKKFYETIKTVPHLDMNTLKKAWYGEEEGPYLHHHRTRYVGLNYHSLFEEKGIEFRYFNGTDDYDRIEAYVLFCLKLVDKASKMNGAYGIRNAESKNEKENFRAWLYRLGFHGSRYKKVRKILMEGYNEDTAA